MAPRFSQSSVEDDTLPVIYASGQKGHHQDDKVTDKAGTLTLVRKVALCAGLMGSEAIGVFDNLNTMPLLQALGAPMYMLTLPGVISASCGVAFLPVMGWIADGGPNPQKRKKPVTIAVFSIAMLGLCFNLASALLSGWKPQNPYKNITIISSHINYSAKWLTTLEPVNGSLPNNMSYFHAASFDEINASLLSEGMDINPVRIPEGEESLILSICIGLTIAGMAFIDLGFDLANSAVKALMLTHSPPADHVSVLEVGVIMAALGGCCVSVSGLVNFRDVVDYLDPVFSQATVQLLFLFMLGILTCGSSILSAPPLLTPTDPGLSCDLRDDLCTDPKEQHGEGGDPAGESPLTPWTEASDNVFFATMTPAEALMSNSEQLERSFRQLSISASFSQSHHSRSVHLLPHHPRHHQRPDNEKTRLLLPEDFPYQAIPEHSEPVTTAGEGADPAVKKPRLKLVIVWLCAFFTACGLFTFNVIMTDYVGKVIFGGDPYAPADSEGYAMYQQGMQTAALCILILNGSYVVSALFQNRVLAVISPKAEYVLVNVSLLALMAVMKQSGQLYLFVACSIVAGMTRTALYTVPFLMATHLCTKPKDEILSPEEGRQLGESGGSSSFGSTMALVTSALPAAYLLTSSFTGPLLDATGDPSSPLLVAMGCLAMSVISICCYK